MPDPAEEESTEQTEGEAAPTEEEADPNPYPAPRTYSRGQEVLHPSRDGYLDVVRELRDEHGFNMCIDVTAVDYFAHESPRSLPDGVDPERYEVVVGLLSHQHRKRVRLRIQVPRAEPSVASLFEIYPGAEALEREVFDMFGIRFEGHPDLTRILMPEDWEGHPLRKQYPVGTIPVQFKGVSNAR